MYFCDVKIKHSNEHIKIEIMEKINQISIREILKEAEDFIQKSNNMSEDDFFGQYNQLYDEIIVELKKRFYAVYNGIKDRWVSKAWHSNKSVSLAVYSGISEETAKQFCSDCNRFWTEEKRNEEN